MKSRKKILAGMVAMALGSGAYAATFEGRLACDNDPRQAATSCMLYVPVTDTVGLPVYTQQISVTYLLEPRGAAAAGMDSEAQSSSDIVASAPMSKSEESSLYPRNEVVEGRPLPEQDKDRHAGTSSSRSGFFGWLKTDRAAGASRDLAASSLVEETDPFGGQEKVAGSRSGPGIFGSRSEQSVAIEPHATPDTALMSESSPTTEPRPSSGFFSWLKGDRDSRIPSGGSRDLAGTSLMEEADPFDRERIASSSDARFSWLTGDRTQSSSERSAAVKPSELATEGGSDPALQRRDLAGTSLMESDQPAGAEQHAMGEQS